MLTYSSDVVAISSCALAHLNLPIEKWSNFSKTKIEQHHLVLKEIIQPK